MLKFLSCFFYLNWWCHTTSLHLHHPLHWPLLAFFATSLFLLLLFAWLRCWLLCGSRKLENYSIWYLTHSLTRWSVLHSYCNNVQRDLHTCCHNHHCRPCFCLSVFSSQLDSFFCRLASYNSPGCWNCDWQCCHRCQQSTPPEPRPGYSSSAHRCSSALCSVSNWKKTHCQVNISTHVYQHEGQTTQRLCKHLLGAAVKRANKVAHCHERMLKDLARRDSFSCVQLQHLCQQVEEAGSITGLSSGVLSWHGLTLLCSGTEWKKMVRKCEGFFRKQKLFFEKTKASYRHQLAQGGNHEWVTFVISPPPDQWKHMFCMVQRRVPSSVQHVVGKSAKQAGDFTHLWRQFNHKLHIKINFKLPKRNLSCGLRSCYLWWWGTICESLKILSRL